MADRYEPLPGVLELPGWLFRRLSRRGKLATGLLIGLAVVGLAVAAAILVPMITENKREDRARERREAAQARRDRVAQLTREQRPVSGRLSVAGGAVAALQGHVLADAQRRVRSGELDTPVKRVDCRHLDGTRDVIFACEAVTSDIPGGEVSRGGRIGYPYRARVQLDTGRFAFCRIAGRPGEGSLGTGVSVPLSAVCGG